MKQLLKLTAIMLFMAGTFACVEKEEKEEYNEQCVNCKEDAKVLKVLKDEPAYVQKGCFIYLEKSYSYSIILVHEDTSNEIFPCGGVPEKFQIDGIKVLISGNIMDCRAVNECFPEYRIAPTKFLELKTIKRTKQ